MRELLATCWLPLLVACATPKPPTAPAPPAPRPAHFMDAYALRAALDTGDLDDVREVAHSFLERHAKQDYPLEWHTRLVRMMAWVQSASDAEDFDTAAAAVDQVFESCGACHRREGVAGSDQLTLTATGLSRR